MQLFIAVFLFLDYKLAILNLCLMIMLDKLLNVHMSQCVCVCVNLVDMIETVAE